MRRLGLLVACLVAAAPVFSNPSAPPDALPSPEVTPIDPEPYPTPTSPDFPPPSPTPPPASPPPLEPPSQPAQPPDLPPQAPQVPPQVTLLKSPATLKVGGWRAEWEWLGAHQALRTLGLAVAVVDPIALRRQGAPTSVLVLANCRNMDKATVLAIKEHIGRGGKVLATYQTSYRQADNRSWTPNNFALSTELGVRFKSWSGGGADCGHLQSKEGPTSITLLRHQAMLVEPLPGAEVLATWDKPERSPAVVAGPGGIYCGEDLLAPENAQSPLVLQLLSGYLRRLEPRLHPRVPPRDKIKSPPPRPPLVALPCPDDAAGVRVGLGACDLGGGRIRLRAHAGPVRFRWGPVTRLCREVAAHSDSGKLVLEAVLESKPPLNTVEFSQVAPTAATLYPTQKNTYLDVFWDSPDGTRRWQAYRGSLEVNAVGSSTSLINVLPVDAYLAGVVPSEVPSDFPDEALKAMAVVARSYSLSHLDRHKTDGFDLCSEVHCQVYRGLAQEAESTGRAIVDTMGQVLVFQGRPADATFHACCGGYGVDVETAWPHGSIIAYLRGLPDFAGVSPWDLGNERDLRVWLSEPSTAFCSGAGRFRWDERIRWSELESKLEQSLPTILGKEFKGLGALKDLRVQVRDVSGRVVRLAIEGEKGHYLVGGDATRWLTSAGKVGAGGLNSSLFVIDVEGAGPERVVHLRGAGWGHGVGMCQEGAAGRARAGQHYREILGHYYQGTQLVKDPSPLPAPVPVERAGR